MSSSIVDARCLFSATFKTFNLIFVIKVSRKFCGSELLLTMKKTELHHSLICFRCIFAALNFLKKNFHTYESEVNGSCGAHK